MLISQKKWEKKHQTSLIETSLVPRTKSIGCRIVVETPGPSRRKQHKRQVGKPWSLSSVAIDGALLREGKGQKGSVFFCVFLGGRMKTLDDDDDDDDDDGCHRFLNSFSKKKETLTSSLQPKTTYHQKKPALRKMPTDTSWRRWRNPPASVPKPPWG